MTRIGFIGLGAMGMPMAQNLIQQGLTVQGFDTRSSALDAFERTGGVRCATCSDAAMEADTLILMVVNASQAETILFGEDALSALPSQATVILMATCPPAAVQRISERVLSSGRGFIDAPVSGGVAGARSASLTIMAAAFTKTFDAAKPLFEALGDKVFHVGEDAGQGATVKAVNQLLCGVHLAVAGEAFTLASKVGVDLQVLLEILSGSSAASWMLKDRGPRMLETDPEVTSAVDIFVKDLGIVLEAGQDTKAALPIAAIAHQMFLAASGRGEGEADDSQVIRSYHALNGIPRQSP